MQPATSAIADCGAEQNSAWASVDEPTMHGHYLTADECEKRNDDEQHWRQRRTTQVHRRVRCVFRSHKTKLALLRSRTAH
jgi:hypothetical protein